MSTAPTGGEYPMAQTLPIASPRDTRRNIFIRLQRRRGRMAVTLLLLLAGTACGLTTPALLGRMVDAIEGSQPFVALAWIALALVLAAIAGAGLTFAGSRELATVVQDVLAELREEVMDSALHLPSQTLDNTGSSDVVSRVTRDVEAVNEAGSEVLPTVVGAGFTIALTITGLAALDPRLAIASLVCLPIYLLATRQFLRGSRPVYTDLRALEAERGQGIVEAVHGAATILSRREQHTHLSLIADRSERAIDRQHDAARLFTRFYGWLNSAEFVGLGVILATGFWLVQTNAITIGAATAAALYFHRLFSPIGALLTSLDDVQRATVGLARLVGVTRTAPQERAKKAALPEQRTSGGDCLPSIQIDNLHFCYGGRPAVRDVTFEVAAGSRVALVGASGSGKSSLARLIAGILEPESGRVTLGGINTTEVRRNDPGRVYLVSQEVHVFAGTVADNLRMSAPAATDAELESALRAVDAQWAIDGGMDVLVGPGGVALDDGATQQLALARVLLADPAVIVLDEATAELGRSHHLSIDAATEAVVRGRTSVIVAHRLDQARRADVILVMRDGRVIENGTHTDLLAAAGEYHRLWTAYSDPNSGD